MAPRLSVSQITTLRSSFAEAVCDYAAAGLAGIGVRELKLGEAGDARELEALEERGLEPVAAVPAVPSVLPLPLLGGLEDPAERVDVFCRSPERLAPFAPASIPDSFWAAPAVETLNHAQAAFEHCWSGGPPSAAPRRLTVKESR